MIILVSGLIFLLLSITGVRTYLAKAMPDCIKKAIPAGIGAIAYVLITLFTGNYKKQDIAVTVIGLLFVCKFIFGTM